MDGESAYGATRDDKFKYPGCLQGSITNIRPNVVASDTQITLTVPCSTICIFAEDDDIHVNWNNGTATTNHPMIKAGTAFTYQGPPMRQFHYIGASATGKVSITAW
ncbi:MAG: hypothetical protein K2X29_11180 [Candidatus Obscuribacterales bacterium]|nr:hypothetical protein [Candidatus Obscuribacterales bacterium]